MNFRFAPVAIALLATAASSVSAFAGPMGNEITDMPKAQSSRSRADVIAETRAALARGSLERSSYDELVGVIADRQAAQAGGAHYASRAAVRAETHAAQARGQLERSSYDEQISVATQRQAQ